MRIATTWMFLLSLFRNMRKIVVTITMLAMLVGGLFATQDSMLGGIVSGDRAIYFLSQLRDTNISSPTSSQGLLYNGQYWINTSTEIFGPSVVPPERGGTGISSATTTDVGKYITVSSSDPFEYSFTEGFSLGTLNTDNLLYSNGGVITTTENMTWNSSTSKLSLSGQLQVDNIQLDNLTINPVGGALVLDDLSWPTADGTNGQVIGTNGAGVLSFKNNLSIGGSDMQIQYNRGGILGAESAFAWDYTNNILTITDGVYNQTKTFGNIASDSHMFTVTTTVTPTALQTSHYGALMSTITHNTSNAILSPAGALRGHYNVISNTGGGLVLTAHNEILTTAITGTGSTITKASAILVTHQVDTGNTLTQFNALETLNNSGTGTSADTNLFKLTSDFLSNGRAINIDSGSYSFIPLSSADTGITFVSTDLTFGTSGSGDIYLAPVGDVIADGTQILIGDNSTITSPDADVHVVTADTSGALGTSPRMIMETTDTSVFANGILASIDVLAGEAGGRGRVGSIYWRAASGYTNTVSPTDLFLATAISSGLEIDAETTLVLKSTGGMGWGTDNPRSKFHIVDDRDALLDLDNMNRYTIGMSNELDTNNKTVSLGFSVDATFTTVGGGIVYERTGDNSQGRFRFYTKQDTSVGNPSEILRLGDDGTTTVYGNFDIQDAGNVVLGTTTGTIFATSVTQKLSFWNATPIVQPTTSTAEATFVENGGGTAINVDSTFGGYTLQQVVQALQDTGLLN